MPNKKPQKRGHRVQTKTAQTAVSGSKRKAQRLKRHDRIMPNLDLPPATTAHGHETL